MSITTTKLVDFGNLTPRQAEMFPCARAVLIATAMQRATITYTDLCRAIGGYNRQNVGTLVTLVHNDCYDRGEPSLAAIAVTKQTGLPGSGYLAVTQDVYADMVEVWDHWSATTEQEGTQ